MNAEKTYRLFLQEVRSEGGASIEPFEWNLLFNSMQIRWINSIQDDVERNQRKEDDLSQITITTDGLPFNPLMSVASANNVVVFPLPEKTERNTRNMRVDSKSKEISYPDYLRMLNVRLVNDNGLNVKCEVLKTNHEDETMDNYYLLPDDEMSYYRLEDGTSYNIGGRVVKVYHSLNAEFYLKISYLRKPFEYFFDESRPEDNTSNINHVVGGGSVPCEFNDMVTNKIISYAARAYLEIRSDPRYQSYTNEQLINKLIN